MDSKTLGYLHQVVSVKDACLKALGKGLGKCGPGVCPMSTGYELEVVAIVAGLMHAQLREIPVNHCAPGKLLAHRSLIVGQ